MVIAPRFSRSIYSQIGLIRSFVESLLGVASLLRGVAAALLVVGLVGGSHCAMAQTAHFSGVQSTLPGTGVQFNAPLNVAVDKSGNVFVGDILSGVWKIPYLSGSYGTPVPIGNFSGEPAEAAVDGSDNLFVLTNGVVWEIPYLSGSYGTPVSVGSFGGPVGIAVDANGNIFILIGFGSGIGVWEIAAGHYGGTAVQIGGSDFVAPTSLVVDGSGNIFVADKGAGHVGVWKIAYTSGTYSNSATQVGSYGSSNLNGIAIDRNEDLFVVDGTVVREMTAASGYSNVIPIANYTSPTAVAVDANGNTYVADFVDQAVHKLTLSGVSFGSQAVGSVSSQIQLWFSFDSGTNISVAQPVALLQGTAAPDFGIPGQNCQGTYSAGDSCYVYVQFTPQAPGVREGAVNLTSGGNVLATAYFSGVGTGPVANFLPGAETLLGSGFKLPTAVAVDGNGNTFVADSGSGLVTEITSGGAQSTVLDLSGTNGEPAAVAVDGAGNVYVADSQTANSTVWKIAPPYTSGTALDIADSSGHYPDAGLSQPSGVAVDGGGNVYIADSGNDRVLEMSPSVGGVNGYTKPKAIQTTSTLMYPSALAADGSGNVYIAESYLGEVLIEPPAGSSNGEVVIGNSSLNYPSGVTVDGNGNVYIADSTARTVWETGPGSSYATLSRIALPTPTVLIDPSAVALDGVGDLYIADVKSGYGSSGQVVKQSRTSGVATFATATVAGTVDTTDNPQKVTLLNFGNAPLNYTSDAAVTDSTGSILLDHATTNCRLASLQTLAANGSCVFGFDFAPLYVGAVSGSLGLTDDSLYMSTLQPIALSATGLSATITLSPGASLPIATVNVAYTPVTFSASGGIGPYTYTVVSSSLPPGMTYNSVSNTLSGTPTLAGSYSLTLKATDSTSPSVGGPFSGTLSYTLLVGFGQIAVGTATPPTGDLTVTIPNGGETVGHVLVRTQGSSTLDFTYGGSNTCVGHTFAAGQSCTVQVNFNPTAAGLRIGAIQLFENDGDLLATEYLSGIGVGAVANFPAGTESVVASTSTIPALTQPVAETVDAAGNSYIVDKSAGAVWKVAPGGTITPVMTSGLSSPSSVAVDGAGNVYIADTGHDTIWQLQLGDTGSFKPPVVLFNESGLKYNSIPMNSPGGLAVDASGNLYVADTGNGRVLEIPLISSGLNVFHYSAPELIATTAQLGLPGSLTVDANGAIYIADPGNHQVVIEPAAGSSSRETVITSGLSAPASVAVDDNGNLYIADSTNCNVSEAKAGSYTSPVQIARPAGSGLGCSVAAALDGVGNLYIADPSHKQVLQWNYVTPPSDQTFVANTLGSISADSPREFKLANFGNATLNFTTAPTITDATGSFAFKTGAGASTCPTAATGTLAANTSCFYALNFTAVVNTPTTTGSLTLTDSSVNGSSPQTIALKGTLSLLTPTLRFASIPAQTYGGSFTASVTSNSLGAVTYSLVSGPATVTSAGLVTLTGVGSVTIRASQAAAGIYGTTTQSTTFTVGKATLTVTPASPTITYGQTVPTYTASYSGFVNGDTSAVLSGAPSLTTTPTVPSAAGSYTITAAAGTLSAANYSFTYQTGTLTIGKVMLTVTANSSTITYGQTVPAYTASYTGFVNGDTAAVLSGAASLTTTPATPSAAGSYTITAAIGTLAATNYSFQFANGTLTIGKAVLTVKANSPTITYGQTVPTYTASYSGFVNGDTSAVLSGAASLTTTPATPSAAGSYTITAALGTLSAANYSFVYQAGTLTIGKAVLTVTASSPTITYGQSLPAYTASYSGFVNGDTSAVLSGAASLTTSPATPSAAGSYTITSALGTLSAANYSFVYQAGTLTINKATLTVTANSSTINYGQTVPTYTASYSGFVNGDTSAVLSGAASLTTIPATPSAAGSYTITAAIGTLAATNYSFQFANGMLTINAVTPTLNFVSVGGNTVTGSTAAAETFGAAPFTVSASSASSGAIAYAVLSGPATITGSTVTLTGAGPVVLVASQAVSGNYGAATAQVRFIVNPATPQITVVPGSNLVMAQNTVQLTATVTSGAGVPTGTVNFLDGTALLGSSTLVNGVAPLNATFSTAGTHTITAVYNGSTNFYTITSAVATESVIDFSLSASSISVSGSAQALAPGSTVTYSLTVVPTGGSSLPVPLTLTLNGLPAGSTANMTPSAWALTSNNPWTWVLPANTSLTGSQNLTIQLPLLLSQVQMKRAAGDGLAVRLAPLSLALLLLPFTGRIRRSGMWLSRSLSVLSLLIVGIAATAGLSGCGSNNNGYFAQQPEDIPITVTVSAGTLSHSTPITLSVQ